LKMDAHELMEVMIFGSFHREKYKRNKEKFSVHTI
jgi:hypothetical protein